MKDKEQLFDIAVFGAGSAGAMAAYAFARLGYRVVVVEQRPLSASGARWTNGVPAWIFDEIGIAAPKPPELVNHAARFCVMSKAGKKAVEIERSPLMQIDMRRLVERLHALAKEKGVRFIDNAHLTSLRLRNGRPIQADIQVEKKGEVSRSLSIRAKLFVDATGIRATLREITPDLTRHCPKLAPYRIINAAHEHFQITDKKAAKNFMARYGVKPNSNLAWFGIDGGYSSVNIGMDANFETGSILTGSLAEKGRKSGIQLIRDFKMRETWAGEGLGGGSGLIPLRHPYHRIACEGLALVGDSANMIYLVHGSGVALGLLAANTLAEEVSRFEDIGSEEATWRYQAAFQRRFGGQLAVLDALVSFSKSLSGDEVDSLMTSGVFGTKFMYDGLNHQPPGFYPAELLQATFGALKVPRTIVQLLSQNAGIPLLYPLYAGYPKSPQRKKLVRFSKRVAKILGRMPDIAQF